MHLKSQNYSLCSYFFQSKATCNKATSTLTELELLLKNTPHKDKLEKFST